MTTTNILKTILLSTIICLSLAFGTIYSLGNEASIDKGGPILTVHNYTDFRLTFPHIDTLRYYLSTLSMGSRFYPEPIEPRACTDLQFNWGGLEHWFGTAGRVNDELTITSSDWPKNEAIVIKLKKITKGGLETVDKEYNGIIDPLVDKHQKEGEISTPRITWKLEWNENTNNGWKITLTQSETGTGVVYDDE